MAFVAGDARSATLTLDLILRQQLKAEDGLGFCATHEHLLKALRQSVCDLGSVVEELLQLSGDGAGVETCQKLMIDIGALQLECARTQRQLELHTKAHGC